MPVARGRVPGDSMAEGLYDILQGSMTWPEPSTSVGSSLPKRCRLVPTAIISHLRTQETEAAVLDPSVQELEGEHWNGCTSPYLSPTSGR